MGDAEFQRKCHLETDFYGGGVLHAAAAVGRIEICKFLIEEVRFQNIDVKNDRGDTPLLVAMKFGNLMAAEYIIKCGANITITDSTRNTPLHWAIPHDNKELVIELLQREGTQIEANNLIGTPLHCAVTLGNAGITNFLLDYGANPNSVSQLNGITPLISAISSGSAQCMKLLLQHGADPYEKVHGMSPLTYAVIEGKMECIEVFLLANDDVDVNSECLYGLRPIEHAALKNNIEVVEFLFGRTTKIDGYHSWSPISIIQHMQSQPVIDSIKTNHTLLKHSMYFKINAAHGRNDPSTAIKWSNWVLFHSVEVDIRLIYNRSISWQCLGEAAFALHDAQTCIRMQPNWATAHARESYAWQMLQNYQMATDAVRKAWELDPPNQEYGSAYKKFLRNLVLSGR
ncbi:hypothetical protein ACS0TY_007546 [Phlomoides rotata]